MMYNDSIKVANKIISYDDLFEIFTKMQEKLNYYKKVYDNEEMKNKMLDYNYQKWTFKDSDSVLKFSVDFYDDTQIKFDNYDSFISIFNNRLEEIKSIWVYFSLNYSVRLENQKQDFYNQHINMTIYENKMDIDVSLSSIDKKIDDVYELIKSKILAAPEKYDEVIRKKGSITTTVGLAIGFIPAFIVSIVLLFVPSIRQIYATGYVIYPLLCLFLAFIIGNVVSSAFLGNYYKNITPQQVYSGYDSRNNKSIYKDDIDKYVNTSEILIGKNVHNLESRNRIRVYWKKYKKWLPYEFIVLIVISIIVLFL